MRIDPSITMELQHKVAASDQAAFEELFRLYYPSLLNFSLKYVHVREVAEEITQDVFVQIWNGRGNLDAIRNLATYLFIAVKNHSLNYLKKYSNYHITVIDEEGSVDLVTRHDPQKELEWKELCFHLNKAVDQLPDQCRTVFRLIKEEGFKYKEVAEILGISPRTVETQLYRALKKLNILIKEYQNTSKESWGGAITLLMVITMVFS